ncbi:sulfite exporter TauE/SafE family protein [Chloroflexota bacterium]
MTIPIVPGVEINLLLLGAVGLVLGVISGFTGVGGGFMMTPALIILGFPAHLAVGTSLAWVTGTAIMGTLRHSRLGNIDKKLGALMFLGMVGGIEIGVRILNAATSSGLADQAVLSVAILALLVIGTYTFHEARRYNYQLWYRYVTDGKADTSSTDRTLANYVRGISLPPNIHFAKSGAKISLWVILGISLFAGILAGFMGVGGGFITIPSMIYLFGIESFMAAGTNLFQVAFSTSIGVIRHTMSGNVIIFAATIMLLGSGIGVQIGTQITRYVHGVSVKYTLAVAMLVAMLVSALKLVDIITGHSLSFLGAAMGFVIILGTAVIITAIGGLFVMELRRRHGKPVPLRILLLLVRK